MTELVCASNFTDLLPAHIRGCSVRDQHRETCLDEECGGCQPRRATRGYLCEHCFAKLDEALRATPELVEHLRSIDTAGAALGERVASSMAWKLPMPQSWQSADELMYAMDAQPIPSTANPAAARAAARDAVTAWSPTEQFVSTINGAVRGIEYFHKLQTILHRFPDKEAERVLPDPLRCHNCQQRSLVRRSPIEYLDDVEVVCPSCGHRHDWWSFLLDSADLVNAVIAAQKSAESAAKKKARAK